MLRREEVVEDNSGGTPFAQDRRRMKQTPRRGEGIPVRARRDSFRTACSTGLGFLEGGTTRAFHLGGKATVASVVAVEGFVALFTSFTACGAA